MAKAAKSKKAENVTTIHKGKEPVRLHYIPEWAAKRRLKKADIAEELETQRSTVGRWFKGQIPGDDYIFRLAALLTQEEEPDPRILFQHPDENWLSRLLRQKEGKEKERLMKAIQALFAA
jgi:transcriptional regulator with XRE-family HTH domain